MTSLSGAASFLTAKQETPRPPWYFDTQLPGPHPEIWVRMTAAGVGQLCFRRAAYMILICSLIWETLTQILLLHRQKLLAQGQLQRPASASGARWPLPSQPVTDIAPHALCHAGLGTSAVSTLPGREVFPFPGGVRRVKKRSLFQAPSVCAVGIYIYVCTMPWSVPAGLGRGGTAGDKTFT